MGGDRGAIGAAAIIASSTFGLYHFSYAQPWNNWPIALTLSVVWLAVTAVFLITRCLWAAVVFNNVMAVTGFVLNRVTDFDDKPIWLGLAVAALGILSLILLPRIVRKLPLRKTAIV